MLLVELLQCCNTAIPSLAARPIFTLKCGMPDAPAAFPEPSHDHAHCIDRAMATAERVCAERGRRLTADRRQVLEILLSNHAALGAYDITGRMDWAGRKPGSYAVYRALDFLEDLGLIHRIKSRNAFVACSDPDGGHGAQFLICTECERIAEIAEPAVFRAVVDAAGRAGFAIAQPIVEIEGLCPHCAGKASEDPPGAARARTAARAR